MATKLKNLRLTSVDLVQRGANQEADICLYKSADDAESPTEREKNIFKRFIGWLRENPAEAEYEAESTVETEDATPADPADLYKSAIFESLQSILTDETLTDEDRGEMITKSIEEYHEAMVELAKFNQNHDELGRFASGGGGAASGGGGSVDDAVKELNGLGTSKGISKVKYEDIKEYEKVLQKFPVGTKLSHKMDAGTEYFEKTGDGDMGITWKHTRAPWNKTDNVSAFDVARWMAGRGNISRGSIDVAKAADIEDIDEIEEIE